MNRIKGLKLASGLGLGTIASLAIIAPVATTLTQKTNTKVITFTNTNVKTEGEECFNPIKRVRFVVHFDNHYYNVCSMYFEFANVDWDVKDLVGLQFKFSNLTLPLPAVKYYPELSPTDSFGLDFVKADLALPDGVNKITGDFEIFADSPRFKLNDGTCISEYSNGSFVSES
jgi:hypothetical protein